MQAKKIFGILFLLLAGYTLHAQQRMNPKGMTYFLASKPNVIIYHDTIFNGVKQFRPLFYRTKDFELIMYVERHQSNKITGQVLGVVGAVATFIGIGTISDNKGAGWALVGGGVATTIASGYFLLMGQRNLNTAVTLFNSRYSNASLGLGVTQNAAGLVYKF